MEKQRTIQQNRALHLYFTHIAEMLNEAGLDIKETIPNFKVDIPWSSRTVKDIIWRTIQKAQLQKHSTTQLTTDEINKVFETVNRFLAQLGLHTPFPSIESLYETYTAKTQARNKQ